MLGSLIPILLLLCEPAIALLLSEASMIFRDDAMLAVMAVGWLVGWLVRWLVAKTSGESE